MRVDIGNTKVWDALQLRIDAMDRAHVKIGFFDGDAHNDDDITTLELALICELGTATLPPRSFLRRTFEVKLSDLRALQAKLVRGILADKLSYPQALDILGAWGVKEVANFIRSDQVTPPTSLATNRRKNVSVGKPADAKTTTLIDTGRLVNAITWEVD